MSQVEIVKKTTTPVVIQKEESQVSVQAGSYLTPHALHQHIDAAGLVNAQDGDLIKRQAGEWVIFTPDYFTNAQWTASAASAIVAQDITNWNASYAVAHPAVSLGTSNGLSLAAGQVLSMDAAGAAQAGVVSIGAQTFAGTKTFNNSIYAGSWIGQPGDVNFGTNLLSVAGDGFFGAVGANVARLRVTSSDATGIIGWNTYWNGTGERAVNTSKGSTQVRISDTGFTVQSAVATAGNQSFVRYLNVRTNGIIDFQSDRHLDSSTGLKFSGAVQALWCNTVNGRVGMGVIPYANITATAHIRGASHLSGQAMVVENWNGVSAAKIIEVLNSNNIGLGGPASVSYAVNVTGQVYCNSSLLCSQVLYGNDIRSISGGLVTIQPTGGAVAIGSSSPVASALLNLVSTTSGLLPPKMTTAQKNAIITPASGLIVYDTTLNKLCVYTTSWQTITSI